MSKLLGKSVEHAICEADRQIVMGAVETLFREGTSQEVLVRTGPNCWCWASFSPAMAIGGVGAIVETRNVCSCFFELSNQQRRIAHKLSQDWSVEKIANHYGVSVNTVRTQILRARRTIGLTDINSLLIWASHHRYLLARYRGSQIL